MNQHGTEAVLWQFAQVTSPRLGHPVAVVAAEDIKYLPGGDRYQTISLYLPRTPETAALVGTPADHLPDADLQSQSPQYLVHIHGGAWRDPQLTAASIEPAVACAFDATERYSPIKAVASINYRVSQFPTHPTLPYDAVKDDHSDPAREAVHPDHLNDVLHAFALLRTFGLTDHSYILSGHSCGACLAFQAILQPPAYYSIDVPDVPCPAAVLGLNGLYDLPALVNGLDASHEHLRAEYETMLTFAFGANRDVWAAASPTRFDPREIGQRVQAGLAPRLVVLDESVDDQLVPMNQKLGLQATLGNVDGLRTIPGHRSSGPHAAPWEQGSMIWDSVQDLLGILAASALADTNDVVASDPE